MADNWSKIVVLQMFGKLKDKTCARSFQQRWLANNTGGTWWWNEEYCDVPIPQPMRDYSGLLPLSACGEGAGADSPDLGCTGTRAIPPNMTPGLPGSGAHSFKTTWNTLDILNPTCFKTRISIPYAFFKIPRLSRAFRHLSNACWYFVHKTPKSDVLSVLYSAGYADSRREILFSSYSSIN